MKNYTKKRWFWMMACFAAVFIGIQFVRKPIGNPPVTAYIQAPDSIERILIRACFNCHSNITQLSWYDKIAPASWIVGNHVLQGRSLVNFSEWDRLTRDQQKVVLFESLNQMQFRIMPLSQYAFIHPSAKITPVELNIFKHYLATLVSPVIPDTIKMRLWKEQYALWISDKSIPGKVRPAPNGITYNSEYKNWTAISSTERFDNGTMRVIVGNDVAVKAAKAGNMKPWPDGSIIVKILWISNMDSSGTIFPGALRQLDFMFKDKKKYIETAGWGFARWVNGLELKPYGKNSLFAYECVRCHQSMQQNDFIYTDPIDLKSPFDLEGKVITSFISHSDATMSTLYGNDQVAGYARMHSDHQYPAGSVLTLVTWNQKEDEHWYGARIPATIRSIETITIGGTGKKSQSLVYAKYQGDPLQKVMNSKKEEQETVIKYILNQQASVMP